MKGKAAEAIAKCKEARVVLSGEVWRGKGMTTERRKLQARASGSDWKMPT